jgi:hypothetical protein
MPPGGETLKPSGTTPFGTMAVYKTRTVRRVLRFHNRCPQLLLPDEIRATRLTKIVLEHRLGFPMWRDVKETFTLERRQRAYRFEFVQEPVLAPPHFFHSTWGPYYDPHPRDWDRVRPRPRNYDEYLLSIVNIRYERFPHALRELDGVTRRCLPPPKYEGYIPGWHVEPLQNLCDARNVATMQLPTKDVKKEPLDALINTLFAGTNSVLNQGRPYNAEIFYEPRTTRAAARNADPSSPADASSHSVGS